MIVNCIYCDGLVTKVKKGEHVIPESLGGTKTLKNVCQRCNESFSGIDNELASRSFLVSVKADCLNKPHETGWCAAAGTDVAIDGVYSWEDQSFRPWTQLTLQSESRCTTIGEVSELSSLEIGRAFRVFARCLRVALRRHENRRRDGLQYVVTKEENVGEAKRVRPTISFRKPLSELNERSTFHVLYATPYQKRLLLDLIDKFDADRIPADVPHGLIRNPFIYRSYDVTSVVRALMKIGINLLAYELGTDFRPETFASTIAAIRSKSGLSAWHFHNAGFCYPEDLADLHGSDGDHSFEVANYGRRWICFGSWFGGRACTAVSFRGGDVPSLETLRVRFKFKADQPSGSDEWQSSRTAILLPRPQRVAATWSDRSGALPQYPLEAFDSHGTWTRV